MDRAGITQQLEAFAQAGLGGVEITPIYGAQHAEDRYLPYLSPAWMEALAHTTREAARLGMQVDMATGTGWPFGAPWVDPAGGSQKLVQVDGHLTGAPTQMQVKRAAPGGEGLVLDPYAASALQRYLTPFDEAFRHIDPSGIRAQFHDSFEYYGAEWTPGLAAAFRAAHGYELDDHAAELLTENPPAAGSPAADALGRLKADYRTTLGELHLDYLQAWADWSHDHGWLVRNQSHGAPANLLDLYGAVDIPETETFGSTLFPIPGLRRSPDEIRSGQDLPEPLMMKMASSAAHVMGRPLTSSETCTWLREHWKTTLAMAKPEIDRLFVNGINHVLYHGTVYSPPDAAWPGWLFYASTQFNPNNPWWQDFAALNAYVTRVQTVLQSGQPDNEVLLYWPYADVVDDPSGLIKQLGVHHVDWLTHSPFGAAARELAQAGFACDYVSDAQLEASRPTANGDLQTPGQTYRLLVVPAARRMPLATLRYIISMVRQGTHVVMLALPDDVPGLGHLPARRAEFAGLLDELRSLATDTSLHLTLGSPDERRNPLIAVAAHRGLRRETMAAVGLEYIRRRTDDGFAYFITNLTGESFNAWLPLGAPATTVRRTDPLDGMAGAAPTRIDAAGKTSVRLQLASGQSVLLHATSPDPTTPALAAWPILEPAGPAQPIPGSWSIRFRRGGPVLPPSVGSTALGSWTELPDPENQRFAGTARYTIEFDAPVAPPGTTDWLLNLGDVRESARVQLNGQLIGTAWSLPFQLRLDSALRAGRNVLEIDVTNLAANRIRDLDRRGIDWRIMHEINFVNIRYRPFDASDWPLTPSGLLGPVTLTPLRPE